MSTLKRDSFLRLIRFYCNEFNKLKIIDSFLLVLLLTAPLALKLLLSIVTIDNHFLFIKFAKMYTWLNLADEVESINFKNWLYMRVYVKIYIFFSFFCGWVMMIEWRKGIFFCMTSQDKIARMERLKKPQEIM